MSTVLIVEDSALMRWSIRKSIENFIPNIASVIEAEDGAQALEILNQRKIDLVLSDYSLPGMNGYDLLQKMKEDPALALIPLILISGYIPPDQVQSFLEQGATHVFIKPFDPQSFLDTISKMVAPVN